MILIELQLDSVGPGAVSCGADRRRPVPSALRRV